MLPGMTLPPSRPLPAAARPLPDRAEPTARAVPVGHVAEALAGTDPLPSLADILAHYRRHGTVARTVAAWPGTSPAPLPATPEFDEPILGLQTSEVHSPDLFDQFFGGQR